MSNFNLIKDPWIAVMTQNNEEKKEVSLLELFSNAHRYVRLAGETPSQDFSTLRFLLAIMHTVFSRFDSDGENYEFVELDEKFKPTVPIDQDDESEYFQKLFETWEKLWNESKFPEIIGNYLLKWEDRFDLYGNEYPFYQLSNED
ncbi:MAG: type I-E CRISPR-associated protein Cse1/CasA, partial [Clostridiaceae bacterium]